MAPTPQATEAGYHNLWGKAVIDPNRREAAAAIARKGISAKARYQAITAKVGTMPWWWIPPAHNRESSMSFTRHLHNGDSLAARTRQVPAGRPKAGSPPFTFEESAIDALTMPPHSLHKVGHWSIERALYEWEKYNGWGYLGKGNSPYVWSWTSLYTGGKYIADHVYSATARDPQAGCVAVMRAMMDSDPSIAPSLTSEPVPPGEVVDHETKPSKRPGKIGAGTAGGGGAGTQVPDKPGGFWVDVACWSAIGVGVGLILLSVVLVARKKQWLSDKWTGYSKTMESK